MVSRRAQGRGGVGDHPLPARWWRLRAVDLRTPGVWDVGHVRFDPGAGKVVDRFSSGSAGAGYGHDEAFAVGPGRWGGRPDRCGDGWCSIGVGFDRPIVPESIVVEDAPGDHRAIRVAVDCSDDGSAWSEAGVIGLDPGRTRHTVFYAPPSAGASTGWRLVSKSSDPVIARCFERARYLRRGIDLDAAVDGDGAAVTVTADSDRELDRIVLEVPAGATAESVLLERLDSAGSWETWRHLGSLGPGVHDLLLHGDPHGVRSRSVVRDRPAESRILVMIASYRDPELAATVTSAITQAAYPEHLRFAICHQYDDDTRPLLDPWAQDPRFRVDDVVHTESRGCCWARHRTFGLYDGEEYVLQIDAHTRFAARWDVRYIEMLESIDSPRPILTTYPPRYTIGDDGSVRYDLEAGVQKLYIDEVRDDLTTVQKTSPPADVSAPGPSPTLAAGQVFTRGTFCTDVVYDPEMYFAGEEISVAARAFTAGYDLFYPDENLVWHRYHHDHPKHWDDHVDHAESHAGAVGRLRTLFRGDSDLLGRFGLGSVRSLTEFEDYAGIDLGAPRVAADGSVTLDVDRSVIEPRDDYVGFVVVFVDRAGNEVARRDVRSPDVLGLRRGTITVHGIPGEASHFLVVPVISSTNGRTRVGEICLRPVPVPTRRPR